MYRNVVPLSRQRHGALRLRPATGHAFAATETLLPLWGGELAKAALAFPVGFVRQEAGYAPVAVLGLEPGRNLFVAPDGRWLGWYLPAALRRYPFLLVRPTGGGEPVIGIDEASELLSETEGEPLFTEGAPGELVDGVLAAFREQPGAAASAQVACAALERAGVIVPWGLRVRTDGGEREMEGLFRVDEHALNALADEAFLELRRSGAVGVAYAQLLSLGRWPLLAQLAAAQARAAARQPALETMLELDPGGSFSFD